MSHRRLSLHQFSLGASARALVLLGLLLPCTLAANPLPATLRWEVETSRPAPFAVQLMRGERVDLEPAFLSYSAPLVLSNVTAVTMRYRSEDMTGSYYVATGYVASATGGVVRIPWSATNDAPATNYLYQLRIEQADGAMLRGYGALRLAPGIDGAGTNRPTAYTSLDWDTIQATGTPPYPLTLLGLGDTPASYAGAAGYVLRVTAGGDGVEFVAGSGSGVGSVSGTNGIAVTGPAEAPIVGLSALSQSQLGTGVTAYALASQAAAAALAVSGRVDQLDSAGYITNMTWAALQGNPTNNADLVAALAAAPISALYTPPIGLWGLDTNSTLQPLPLALAPAAGLWAVSNGILVPSTNPAYDAWWIADGTNIVPRNPTP